MDYDPHAQHQQRQTFLTILLTLLLGGGFLCFLVIISGGFLLYLVPTVVGIGLFGCLHYLLWGRAFTRETADEASREDATAEGDEWIADEAKDAWKR